MLMTDKNIDRFFGTYERPVRWPKKQHFDINWRIDGMDIKKDCFAYRIGRCSVMTEMICRREKCSFYKTKEQDKKDREIYGFKKNYRPKSEGL